MVFWIAILAGVLFIWLAVRLGFYETWILFFNVVVSIYVSIFLGPTIARLAPLGGGGAPYATALSMLVLAGGCFAVLHGLSYVFLTGQFSVAFPRFFDVLLAGALGFVAGFLILSFVALVITTTPLAEHEMIRSIGFSHKSQQANLSCLARCCDLVHSVAASGPNDNATRAAVERLLEKHPAPAPDAGGQHPDANDPLGARDQHASPRPLTAGAAQNGTLDDTDP
ncbi:MAG: hypothetical protein A2Y76_00220 [Planctomycetes bacterium RBG_13_60_9]|nr:MAG: hypothetical protein A2Y76_00220 [Planctomycetes bacterium RBG_13_60_9]